MATIPYKAEKYIKDLSLYMLYLYGYLLVSGADCD